MARRRKFYSKIHPGQYIVDHFATLVDQNSKKPGWDDRISFIIIPAVGTFMLWYLGFKIDSSSVETVVAGLAIFVGLLFNALVILIDSARKQDDKSNRRVKHIKQLIANISFCIFLSVVTIPIMLLGFVTSFPEWAKLIINLVSFFLLAEFIMIFLMIMKRTYILFEYDLSEIEKGN